MVHPANKAELKGRRLCPHDKNHVVLREFGLRNHDVDGAGVRTEAEGFAPKVVFTKPKWHTKSGTQLTGTRRGLGSIHS